MRPVPGNLLDTLQGALRDHLARRRYVGRHRADQRVRYVASVPVRSTAAPRTAAAPGAPGESPPTPVAAPRTPLAAPYTPAATPHTPLTTPRPPVGAERSSATDDRLRPVVEFPAG